MKHVSSDLFKQSATLTILPVGDIAPTEESIKSFFADVVKREKEKGNPEVLFDEDLWNLFRNNEPGFSTLFTSIVYRFKKSISTKKVLDQVQDGIKKIYTYTQCIAIANALVLANEVDTIETGIIIYFGSKQKDGVLRVEVFRDDISRLSIHVLPFDFGDDYQVDDGVCFTEEIQKN